MVPGKGLQPRMWNFLTDELLSASTSEMVTAQDSAVIMTTQLRRRQSNFR